MDTLIQVQNEDHLNERRISCMGQPSPLFIVREIAAGDLVRDAGPGGKKDELAILTYEYRGDNREVKHYIFPTKLNP